MIIYTYVYVVNQKNFRKYPPFWKNNKSKSKKYFA